MTTQEKRNIAEKTRKLSKTTDLCTIVKKELFFEGRPII